MNAERIVEVTTKGCEHWDGAEKIIGASERKASWGNWGITFYTETRTTPGPGNIYGVTYDIHGSVYFPCGAQGPMDGHIGSPERANYRAIVQAWIQNAQLPHNLVGVTL